MAANLQKISRNKKQKKVRKGKIYFLDLQKKNEGKM